ncbi:probable RNA polymerase II subunit A C-terminal domain phosphatase [Coccomyxa sp. Obi]|nr:probable RNA polymerase II subunit A C-terminal domain phosphatase [Coccomyxa sp. Obi]
MANGSVHSDSGSDLAALLEQELDSISLPGSPRDNLEVDSVEEPRQTKRQSALRVEEKRSLKRPKSGILTNGGSESVCPPHPGFMYGMCIRCGTQADEAEADGDAIALRYIHSGLKLSASEAERVRQQSLKRVISDKKLLLVLDLDHTLLNSTRFEEAVGFEEQLAAIQQARSEDQPESLYHLEHMHLWTKLRPYVREFLEKAHEVSEMHIYTHGNAEYAAEMAKLLDPTKRFFAERIISQGDSTVKHVKDLDVVLGAEKAVVILDDTAGVWPAHQRNLLQVERYVFFPACARRFELETSSLLEQGRDEDEQEGMLASALRVLQQVHERFFAAGADASEQDVREHLQALRGAVLSGCRICFSRIIPQGDPMPEAHHLWQQAQQLGAVVTLGVDEDTTHVVAAAKNTDKVHWAADHNRHIVSPAWLHACACLWRRMDEGQFPVGAAPVFETKGALSAEEDTKAALAGAGGGVATS